VKGTSRRRSDRTQFADDPGYLNTPRLVADSTGTTVWKWDQQEPFGDSPPDENPSGLGVFENNLRFRGQYFDKETGLFYNYFRDYDSAIGGYKQSDLIGLKGGLNTYAYVKSNPLRYGDPRGLLVNDGTCSAEQWVKIEGAEARIGQIADSCIPCKDRVGFKTLLKDALVGCVKSDAFPPRPSLLVDAYTTGASSFALTPGGLNPAVGCLEATIVHDITHLLGYPGEATPIKYEKACFSCAPDRPAP
jgi:RHS repeat-associated protein